MGVVRQLSMVVGFSRSRHRLVRRRADSGTAGGSEGKGSADEVTAFDMDEQAGREDGNAKERFTSGKKPRRIVHKPRNAPAPAQLTVPRAPRHASKETAASRLRTANAHANVANRLRKSPEDTTSGTEAARQLVARVPAPAQVSQPSSSVRAPADVSSAHLGLSDIEDDDEL